MIATLLCRFLFLLLFLIRYREIERCIFKINFSRIIFDLFNSCLIFTMINNLRIFSICNLSFFKKSFMRSSILNVLIDINFICFSFLLSLMRNTFVVSKCIWFDENCEKIWKIWNFCREKFISLSRFEMFIESSLIEFSFFLFFRFVMYFTFFWLIFLDEFNFKRCCFLTFVVIDCNQLLSFNFFCFNVFLFAVMNETTRFCFSIITIMIANSRIFSFFVFDAQLFILNRWDRWRIDLDEVEITTLKMTFVIDETEHCEVDIDNIVLISVIFYCDKNFLLWFDA